MTDAPSKTPIRALIEAVESGTFAHFDAVKAIGNKGISLPPDLCTTRSTAALKAYHGSLDAALALHEALLPGWGLVVNCGNDYASVRHNKDIHLSDDSFFHADSENPARAALLAILKAYEAQQ